MVLSFLLGITFREGVVGVKMNGSGCMEGEMWVQKGVWRPLLLGLVDEDAPVSEVLEEFGTEHAMTDAERLQVGEFLPVVVGELVAVVYNRR
jgi:hypothetical protein